MFVNCVTEIKNLRRHFQRPASRSLGKYCFPSAKLTQYIIVYSKYSKYSIVQYSKCIRYVIKILIKLEVTIASEVLPWQLQYFTRLAGCTIECDSIVLVCITLYTKNYNKEYKNEYTKNYKNG